MSRWKFCTLLMLTLALGALGCHGGGSSTSVTLTISPTVASVITNTTQQFISSISGSTDQAVAWTVTCPTGVTAPACGTIDPSTGLYTAPKTIPTVPSTTAGTPPTVTPTATITATAHADASKTAVAKVTIVSGIRIAITPANATVGTGETFDFAANISNPGCNQSLAGNTCLNVTWSLPTTPTGIGSIDANGVYTAPGTAPSPSTVTITATSVNDTAVTATASVTVVTATDPTLTSVSPKTAARGSLFQDIYITGTNFISTNKVFVNGVQVDPLFVTDVSSSVISARITDTTLAASGTLQVTVSRQSGQPQNCTPDITQCQVALANVRPAIVGPSPDSIPQGTAGALSFNVNGGFFGTAGNPAVNAFYDGQSRAAQVSGTPNSTRQLSMIIGGASNPGDFGISGLHQVTISSIADPTKFAATNIAVQPDVASYPPTPVPSSPLAVGTGPSDVAINPATGMAVVANTGSNDVTLIDMTAASPAVIAASICTAAVGAGAPCPSSGPKTVAVAHLRTTNQDIALVANSASKTIAEIDLNARAVIWVSPPLQDSPVAVGINPVTGRALVAMNTKNYGMLLDLTPTTQTSPVILGAVSMSTGPNSHIAVEPHLNWAIATPGGLGSMTIVDLNRHTTNNIVSVSRSAGQVTVTVQPSTASVPQSPLAVSSGDAVQIQGISDNSFNGIYTVNIVGPGNSQFGYSQANAPIPPDKTTFNTPGTVNYAEPIATLAPNTIQTQGIAINPETQQAILLDPNPNTPTSGVSFFSLLDQSVSSVALTLSNGARETGAAAGAFNPLTNTAYVVNTTDSSLSVIDPANLTRLPTKTSVFPTGHSPVAVAVDPASNSVIVVNQADNTVSIFSLGSNTQQVAITETSPKTFTTYSTLSTAPTPAAQTLTVIGKGFTSTSQVRLDGVPLPTSLVNAASDRRLVATVPPSLLMNARRFAVDVQNSSGPPSNASDFTVIQSVDVSAGTGCTAAPLPAGVAIDAQQNIAVVSLAGCNTAALINLSNGTGQTVGVGSSPVGVGVISRLHKAVVANNGSGNASVVDELGPSVTNTITTGAGSEGVSVDQTTGEAAVANTGANTVSLVNVATAGSSSISTGSMPIATAFNYQNHQIAVANSGSNTVSVTSGTGSGAFGTTFNVSLPTSLVYDPSPNDCGATNTAGCFLANSSTTNLVEILDPVAQSQSGFRVGINPTAIAYNYLTSTLISTNTGSHTVTVFDFIGRRIRAVLTLPAPLLPNSTLALTGTLQFAVDIHPLTNLAVIADMANGRVLFVPVPR
jgi:DNA-binding beta-propeller fold protein YncE